MSKTTDADRQNWADNSSRDPKRHPDRATPPVVEVKAKTAKLPDQKPPAVRVPLDETPKH